MMWRSKPTATGRSRFRTAQSSPLCTTVTSPPRKMTKSLVIPNPSFPDHPPTSNLWSRIQKNTPPPAAGDTHISTRTVNLAPRRHSKPALPATPKLLATPSSPNTHPDTNNRTERLHLERIVARQSQRIDLLSLARRCENKIAVVQRRVQGHLLHGHSYGRL